MIPFRNIDVWHRSYRAAIAIYRLTRSFPADERYGLTSQLRRAAVSVPTNLAEGSKRLGLADQVRFINMSESSTAEMICLLNLARDLEYAEGAAVEALLIEYEEISKMLYAFRRSLGS